MLDIRAEGLFSPAAQFAAPHKAERLNRVRELCTAWTAPTPQDSIYSGYRRQILAGEGLKEAQSLAHQLRNRFDTLLVLGIGGSALGAKCALQALLPAVPPAERRRVLVAENLDPVEFEQLWASCKPERTAIAVVSKSGGTIESLSQLAVLLERLEQAKLPWREQVVAITDPTQGPLRAWAHAEKLAALAVPPDVGGRFSVLTPVGILPLAFAGLDVAALVEGAQAQLKKPDDAWRLGLRMAELEEAGYCAHVLMPYATLLRDFGLWFVQLWGESLGKKRVARGNVGPIPVAALGATDQHSLLQLLVEGPARLVTGFVRIEKWAQDPVLKNYPAPFREKLGFAEGRSLGQILNAEQKATAQVLSELGRPCYEISLPELDARNLGQLFAFYMDLTTACAAAHECNPYDQPGVELGKKILPQYLR